MSDLLSSLGSVCAVIGAQWGDEGKGKVIDILAEHSDVIARANGGANAGHTVVIDDKKWVLHLVPCGCFHKNKPLVLGSGMVIHLPTLLEEIRNLEAGGFDIVPRLHISGEAHILFDYHKEIDGVQEEERTRVTGNPIGTTRRGIGPAYMEKAARTGIRMEDLGEGIESQLKLKAPVIERMYGVKVNVPKEMEACKEAEKLLRRCIGDATLTLHNALHEKKTILIEGAQASLLDLDHGTYPFVTSSSTISAGLLHDLGLPPQALSSCIGVAKAYCTRVGSGAFLTEVSGATGDRLRERGGEYGATTGRPRRCGWLSIPDLLKTKRLNGITHWNITKLDVLDEEQTIPVCIEVNHSGEPGYRNFPGWRKATSGIRSFEKLPQEAQDLLLFIEEQTATPVAFIGTGQGREDMIVRDV